MNKLSKKQHSAKRTATTALLFGAILITISGLYFGGYCAVHQISYQVLNTNVPGLLLGLVAAFLGARYIRATVKLRQKLQDTDVFCWSNFRPSKPKSV